MKITTNLPSSLDHCTGEYFKEIHNGVVDGLDGLSIDVQRVISWVGIETVETTAALPPISVTVKLTLDPAGIKLERSVTFQIDDFWKDLRVRTASTFRDKVFNALESARDEVGCLLKTTANLLL